MEHKNINSSNNNTHNNMGHENGYVTLGVPIHSQVMKIKQEFEKIQPPSLEQLEVRRAVCKINSQQRSRSPLGLAKRPISVGE